MAQKKPVLTKTQTDIYTQLQVIAMAVRVLRGLLPHVPHRNLIILISDHIQADLHSGETERHGIVRALVSQNSVRGRYVRVAAECGRLLAGATGKTRQRLDALRRKSEQTSRVAFVDEAKARRAEIELAGIAETAHD